MMTKRVSPLLMRTLMCALAAGATRAGAQTLPEIRPLGPVVAKAAEQLGEMIFVRHVKAGLLVNDVRNRRLLFFDSTLTDLKVVADTTPATANAYSGRTGGLIAYHGDSSLFVDPQSLSMLVIDPLGNVGRVMSVPRSQDAMVLGNTMFGTPALDAEGRLVYRSFPRPQFRRQVAAQRGSGDRPAFTPPEIPDSTSVMRIDLSTRQLDTLGFVRVPRVKLDMQTDDNGNVRMAAQMNPLPVVDEWAVLSDGSVAFVRGRDYHIDWIRPDGTRESTPKIPFDWQRLTDEDKVAFLDSLKAARERMGADSTPAHNEVTVQPRAGGGQPGRRGQQMIVLGGPPGGAAPDGSPMMPREMSFVTADELPDYKPPFFAGAVRADGDGRLWIRTIPTRAQPGGPVYDIINTKGELVERVQVPANRTIVGFGPDGIVYLLARENGSVRLEKARSH